MAPAELNEGASPGAGLVRIGKPSDFPEGAAVPVTIGARQIAIYRKDGVLYALDDICPHMGEFLHRLPPEDHAAVCIGHGRRFDLRTGRCIYGGPGEKVAVYPVEVRGDSVLVRIGS